MEQNRHFWFTNLPHNKINEEIILFRNYNEKDYPKYDNYDAINVDKVSDIPCDYYGVMGVPITFLGKYNPNQFEIVGEARTGGNNEFDLCKPIVNGNHRFNRVFIKRKDV